LHTQRVARANDGTQQGIGVLEQVGPYAPADFAAFLDRAKG
jgi:hypothetical protein